MARLESVAVGGYYPTPPALVPRIARLLSVPAEGAFSVLDPCAGDGAAIVELVGELFAKGRDVELYAVEMEATRFAALQNRRGHDGAPAWGACKFLHGDAFRATWSRANIWSSSPSGRRCDSRPHRALTAGPTARHSPRISRVRT